MIHLFSNNISQENIRGLFVDDSQEVSMPQSRPVLPQRPKLTKQSKTSFPDDDEFLEPVTNSATAASSSSSATAAFVTGTAILRVLKKVLFVYYMNPSLHTAESVFTFAILQFSTDLLRL